MIRDFQMVPIENCVAIEEFNTRTKGLGDITDLTESIKAVGILEPILGKDKENGNKEIEVYAGFRRLAAAQAAELAEVPVLITPRRRVTRKQMLLGNVAENVHREDLNPVDEAYAMKRLHEEHEMSLDDIALELGLKKARVKSRFKLLRLNPVVLEAVHVERIAISAAMDINRLPIEKQAKYITVAEDLRGTKLTTLINKELEKIEKQTEMAPKETKPKEETPIADVTEHVRLIRSCSSVICSSLGYNEQEKQDVKDVDFRPLESDDLKRVAKLFDGVADLMPDKVAVNEKVNEEIVKIVETDLSTKLDAEAPVVRQAFIQMILERSKELAIEKAAGSGKRPKVTFVLAKEAIAEFFKTE